MNNFNPTISIIIPVYNHSKELPKCLDSIFSQSFQDFEVVIVNDGSTDGIERVLGDYMDKHIAKNIKIINQSNQGAPAARNNGFKESNGRFILFSDADIEWGKDALEKMLKALEDNPRFSYAYSNFKFGLKSFYLFPFDEEKLKKMNYIHTSALIRRQHFPEKGFDPSLKKFQDWDLWLTMLEEGYKGVWINEVLFTLKPRRNGMSEWLPRFMYKINWKKFGIRIKAIEKYNYWRDIVREKHKLREI